MFPNPQEALPLPLRPNVEQYKKLAKELVRACKSGQEGAIRDWSKNWIETLAKLAGLTITPWLPVGVERWIDSVEDFARRQLRTAEPGAANCDLTNAQFVIARSHGFESWPRFAQALERLASGNSSVSRFEAAADAIISGGVDTLDRLLRENPELIPARSTREHRATLLHYVSANGVEGYRQRTPKNAVEIAEILLKSGAEVDAEADVYGGGATTLGLVATSVHPQRAGVQIALMEKLLEYGAAIDHPTGAGNRHALVHGCFANGQPRAAEFLAKRGAALDLESAAGLGRLDLVERYFHSDGKLRPGATKEQLSQGFLWASGYGQDAVVEFLLEHGADLGGQDHAGQTALHWAAIGGHPHTVKLLVDRKAPLEVENRYGGTVFGQTLWSAAHGGDPDVYAAIIEVLIAAGARLPDRHPPVNKRIDDLLIRFGSCSDPELWWYGEKLKT